MRVLSGIYFIAMLIISFSCTQEKPDKQHTYFDIEGYFKKEAERLQKKNPTVEKKISKNKDTEQKTLRIENWNNELELFSSSDINKPAWKNSYSLQQNKQIITYTANSPELRTQKISIQKNTNNAIKRISILNQVKNSLYNSVEELNYYPDSLYQIKKQQKVQLLGANNYTVTGRLIKKVR